MASGGSSGRTSSGPRSFDFGSDDVLCSYDDFDNQDPSNGKRPEHSAKDYHESRIRPLFSAYGQQDQYPKEEIISAVEKCMKKYADNLLRHLEGISGRLSQLEVYCYKLERSIGEFRADMIRDNSEADTKLKSLEKHLQEVHRSIQILRDKQELAETQKELSKLQFVSKESSSPTRSQKNEEVTVPASVPEPKRHDDTPEMSSQHLALALPHQIAASTAHPTRAPDQHQHFMQQQQPAPPLSMPQDRYTMNQPAPYYPQQSQPLQPELRYIQARPQIQDPSVQAPPTPQQQPQVVNQTQPQQQPYPQYQQQWPQPSQQFAQQMVVPTQQSTSQAQLVRSRTPPTYPYPPQQSANPETFSYATPQSSGNRSEPVPFGYGAPGTTVNIQSQPQHQASSQASFGPPPSKAAGGYLGTAPYPPQSNIQGYNTVYGIDAGRVQNYQPGNYPPPGNVPSIQQLPASNTGGFHHPGSQMMRPHPYADIIEKAVSMGFPREQVASAINRMGDSGQPIDFNALLDRLNSQPAPGGPLRAWSG